MSYGKKGHNGWVIPTVWLSSKICMLKEKVKFVNRISDPLLRWPLGHTCDDTNMLIGTVVE